jgi:hypothetical protein
VLDDDQVGVQRRGYDRRQRQCLRHAAAEQQRVQQHDDAEPEEVL